MVKAGAKAKRPATTQSPVVRQNLMVEPEPITNPDELTTYKGPCLTLNCAGTCRSYPVDGAKHYRDINGFRVFFTECDVCKRWSQRKFAL